MLDQDKKGFTERFIAHLQDAISSDDLWKKFRRRKRDFIRRRVLSFARTVVLLCTGQKMSLQNRVNEFFATLGGTDRSTSATAFLKARDKVRPEVFKHLTTEVTGFFYEHFGAYGEIQAFQEHRLVAIDGSVLNMPNTPEMRAEFTVIDNKSGRPYVQAQTSYLYDVLNGLPLNAGIGALQAEKDFIFGGHDQHFRPGDIILLDRLYSDYEVLARVPQAGRDVIVRGPITGNFKAVETFAQGPTAEDQTVTLSLSSRQRRKGLSLPASLTVRLVKVYLETGETEVLITSLLDSQKYPREAFQWLYHQRWGVETYIGQLKHHWDVERVSSGKVDRTKQDFYASVFLTAFSLVLAAESEAARRTTNASSSLKYAYKLNKSVIASTVATTVIELLLDKKKTSPLE